MTAIFRRALGADFDRLHPAIQERFDVSSAGGSASVGRGTMDHIWHGPRYTVPFLWLGSTRNILFPETGTEVPFTIENYGYVDGFGRETLTFVRTFELAGGRRRRFDATMVYSEQRGCVIDYLGTRQHIAVDLHPQVSDVGGLRIVTGAQRIHEGPLHVGLPNDLTGHADVHEWFDEQADRLRIDVAVRHPRLGPIFGYRGSFAHHRRGAHGAPVPEALKPTREQSRV